MSNLPADVVNEALDAIGADFTIGELREGTKAAQVALRHYGQCLRQLLRSAHWDMARKQQPLTMLADATGQTAGVGTVVPAPWVYEYSYPVDCMLARFVPANYLNPTQAPSGNYALPATPQTTGASQPPYGYGMRLVPAPFIITLDSNYPVDANSNWMEVQGAAPGARVVILSNVNQAALVYTGFVPYPSVWDAHFRAALVAYLASCMALPLTKDKALGVKMRDEQFQLAKERVTQARISNGNESGFPQTTDHLPDWMSIRSRGGGAWGQGWNSAGLWGVGGYGWDGCGYAGYGFDQSVF